MCWRFISGCALLSLSFLTPSLAAELIDNSANAIMMANQAKSLVQQPTKPLSSLDNNQKTRDNRGSAISDNTKEAECGGIAIGNVRPPQGNIHPHNTTVIIRGNVINANNKC